ncbi:Retrotransposable element Tf2 protein [Rhizoctonia solani]|uniref:Retrotransposable element Tf2 protein n=1 Tax=Rhizoctonia solani TaxID=456999 RepID=A0A8H8NNI4_9AGAM|nr:Retrotransposable element Tf2 protein [Rhizoctonia solani]QRW15705.1 Retrotransposable element Tf2 protein [Rhizoctonia solani]
MVFEDIREPQARIREECWNERDLEPLPQQQKPEEALPSLGFLNLAQVLTIEIRRITDIWIALIDSGSSANLINTELACSHNIQLIELDSTRSVIGMTGRKVHGCIRSNYGLVFSLNRPFSAIFYALPLGNRNLILGTPWLKLAIPDIDWNTMKFSLCLATEAQVGNVDPEPQNFSAEFQESQKVFNKVFFTLTEHCLYDIPIGLEDE